MKNFSQIIGENIKKLMELHGMNINEMAEKLDVTRQTMSKYISGESVIDSEKLFIIANLFNKPLTYFLDDKQEELSFMFRANNPKNTFSLLQKNNIETIMDKVYEAYKLSGEIISYIPEQYNLEDIKLVNKKLPSNIEKLLEKIALEQRELLDVGEATGAELVRSFERKGIRVIFQKLNDPDLFAASAFHEKKGSYIFVNDDDNFSEERKIFSMVHEYAHLIFHRDLYKKAQFDLNYSDYIVDVNEKVANAFAGYFLIPRDMVYKYNYILKDRLTYRDLFFIKKELKLSLSALVLSLRKYEYFDDIVYKRIWENLRKNGFDKNEPEPIDRFEKNEKYNNIVKKMFLSEQIGVSKVAELLNIKVIDAREKSKEWLNDAEEI